MLILRDILNVANIITAIIIIISLMVDNQGSIKSIKRKRDLTFIMLIIKIIILPLDIYLNKSINKVCVEAVLIILWIYIFRSYNEKFKISGSQTQELEDYNQ